MHTFKHEESGVHIIYNGDYSGDAKIFVPRDIYLHPQYDEQGNQLITVPCSALVDFSKSSTVEQIIGLLENL